MVEAATSLEQLKQQAEAQQRRRAPPLSGKEPKKRKLDGQDAEDDEQEQEGIVSRYTYAAADAIAAGSTCLMASCGFNRYITSTAAYHGRFACHGAAAAMALHLPAHTSCQRC